jgi:hypothetical protein
VEYLLLFFILLIFSLYNEFSSNSYNKYLFATLIAVVFIVFGGLRDNVGQDWNAYFDIYNKIKNFEDIFTNRQEKGYLFFVYLFNLLSLNFNVFILFLFSLSFVLKYNVIKKYSTNIQLSLLIYFYTVFLIYDLNGIRQGVALSLIFISINSIIERKLHVFLLLLLCASLFHMSALVFFPFYYLYNIKINNKVIVITTVVVLILSIPLRNLILSSSLVQGLLALDQLNHYSVYVTSNDYVQNVSIISAATFQRLFIFFSFLFFYENIDASENVKRFLKNVYFLSVLLYLLLSFSAEYAARLGFYYKIFEILIIPLVISSQRIVSNKILLFLIFVLFAYIGTDRLLSIPHNGLTPYHNILTMF